MGFDPITIALIAGGVSAAGSVYQASQAKKGGGAPAPMIQDPIKPPQPAAQPEMNAIKNSLTAGGGAGIPSTALTGPDGIPKDKLLLGKATVLGA